MGIQTGGPAFPSSGSSLARQQAQAHGFSYQEPVGMTLRDYFAAKAMQGLLSTEYYRGVPHNFVAQEGYRVADEMLAARINNKEK